MADKHISAERKTNQRAKTETNKYMFKNKHKIHNVRC